MADEQGAAAGRRPAADLPPVTPVQVIALAEVIADAHERGIRHGGYTLARWILDAGYRRQPPAAGRAAGRRGSWWFLAAVALAAASYLGGTMAERSMREPAVLAVAVAMIGAFVWLVWLSPRAGR